MPRPLLLDARKDAYVGKFVLEVFNNLFFCLSRFIGVNIDVQSLN
jgi:hypothetical protein